MDAYFTSLIWGTDGVVERAADLLGDLSPILVILIVIAVVGLMVAAITRRRARG